jgi:hypothetical protein
MKARAWDSQDSDLDHAPGCPRSRPAKLRSGAPAGGSDLAPGWWWCWFEVRRRRASAVHQRHGFADVGTPTNTKGHTMGYGIGGILILILVILAIIYFAKRV